MCLGIKCNFVIVPHFYTCTSIICIPVPAQPVALNHAPCWVASQDLCHRNPCWRSKACLGGRQSARTSVMCTSQGAVSRAGLAGVGWGWGQWWVHASRALCNCTAPLFMPVSVCCTSALCLFFLYAVNCISLSGVYAARWPCMYQGIFLLVLCAPFLDWRGPGGSLGAGDIVALAICLRPGVLVWSICHASLLHWHPPVPRVT